MCLYVYVLICIFYKVINKYIALYWHCEPSSSVSIVSGYGLDFWLIEVRSPAEAKGFFF
jgi:hypothetical protein